jgi:hypothetical protein
MAMRTIFFLLSILVPFLLYGQSEELSRDARKIKDAHDELMKDARAPINKMRYIAAFPATKEKYTDIFYPYEKDELFEVRKEYMEHFISIGKVYPKEVLEKSIGIAKKMNGSDDVISMFQQNTTMLAGRESVFFAKEVKKLKKAEQASLIKFLADVEHHATYPEYQSLIDSLTADGEKALAEMLVLVREAKKKERHE